MSWMGTLAKVGMGVMVAKGVGKMVSNRAGGASGGLGGLGGMLGGMMGGQQGGGSGGGLGGMLGGMMGGQQGGAGGGLGGMLGSVLGGGAAGGGLGSILSGSGMGGAAGGGLGGLLDSLSGGGAQQNTGGMPPAPQQGGFGGALNSAFDNFGEPEVAPTNEQEETAKVMLRCMLSAAKADGKIDENEKEKILGQMEGMSDEEMQFVRAELAAPLDLNGLVNDVPKGAEQQAYLMSVMAIDLDSRDEAQYLDSLAKALGIDPQTCNAIHDQLGAPQLYS